ncbi:MAG: nitroreductase [Desulfobacterales bacterium]|nr:nitroreductase [Desulfobacterales bacterium]
MNNVEPITEIMKRRRSSRTFTGEAIQGESQRSLEAFLSGDLAGPFGARPRFQLLAAAPGDLDALKGLGTYGFIRGASGFIVGAVKDSWRNLEDYGYVLEKIILNAEGAGLGTCWLGGSFNKSAFSEKISAREDEFVPAVAAAGYIAPKKRVIDSVIRWGAGSKKRKPWHELFFQETFRTPLMQAEAASHAAPLELTRLAPSSSNRQPWRVVRGQNENMFHFYLQRTKGYYKRNKKLFNMADLQRVDMGIAMCHFELACEAHGLAGSWKVEEPEIGSTPESTEYLASWVGYAGQSSEGE